MILEAAMLRATAGRERKFETAFGEAVEIIAVAKGYRGHELQRCLEVSGKCLLLVRWDRVEDHIVGFRESEGYDDWKRLLHCFYDPFPTVEHFVEVDLGSAQNTRR